MTFRKRCWNRRYIWVMLGGDLLIHGYVAGLVHVPPLFVPQDEFAQRVVALVRLERQELRRVHGRLQQVARGGDLGAVEQRLVGPFSNVLGNVLRRDQMLAYVTRSWCSHTHTLCPSVTSAPSLK